MTMMQAQIKTALTNTIDSVKFDQAQSFHHGKVRDSFIFNTSRAIVVSDRVSAFDYILGTIPFKGAVLNQVAAWWFKQLDSLNINHHLLKTPHPNISIVKNATVIPIEIIVRGYLTGTTKTSSWYAYQNLDRMICDTKMPADMEKNQAFENLIITPTTKPEHGHDEGISKQQILDQGLLSPFCELMCLNEEEIWQQIESVATQVFTFGQKVAKKHGLILVDTKYEMGIDEEGELMLIDEVHTPDSSRYWVRQTYKSQMRNGLEPDSLDKEFVRRMIVDAGYDVDSDEDPSKYLSDEIKIQASLKYIDLYEKMTGTTFDLHEEASITETLAQLA